MLSAQTWRRVARRRAKGQALAEFALVAPIFFLLVFGVIQIGLVVAAQNGLVDGVRTAARRAATYRINEESFNSTVFPSICASVEGELEDRLKDELIGYAPSRLTSSVVYEWKQNPSTGEYFLVARVDATFANQLYVPLVGAFLDGADGSNDGVLRLTASEQMRIENPSLDTPISLAAQAC